MFLYPPLSSANNSNELIFKNICNKGLVLFLFPHRTHVLDSFRIASLTEANIINIQAIVSLK